MQSITIPALAVERVFTPFTHEAGERLTRMKILDRDGNIDVFGIDAMCATIGANLYENLYETGADIETFHENLAELFFEGEIIGAYFYLCTQYGLLGEPVPEQLLWLSTHHGALAAFIESLFVTHHDFLIEDGIISGDDSSDYDDKIIKINVEVTDRNRGGNIE